MSLQLQAIDRLFDRLSATYGRGFLSQYAGLDANAVKAAWGHELSGFAGNLQALAWALENLPERCPNVIEFRNLARRAPAPEVQQLPEPKVDAQRVKAELAKLGDYRKRPTVSRLDWARAIIARNEAGQRSTPTVLRFAHEALRGQA